MLTYSAITVVTGLTTVYCRTPSLHLNRRTLEKEMQIIDIHLNNLNDDDKTVLPNCFCLCLSVCMSFLTLPWPMEDNSRKAAEVNVVPEPLK